MTLFNVVSLKKGAHKKILLLKKKALEALFDKLPWNSEVMMALCSKYVSKIKIKPENYLKVVNTILEFLVHQEYAAGV